MQKVFSLLVFLIAANILQAQNVQKLGLRLENYEYPYSVEMLKLETQQQTLEMAYMDVKPDNYNGQNLLLFHGKNFNGAYWETTIDALTKEGFRVIVPDQIGFGKSSKPDYYQYTFQQLAQNTKNLLEHLNIEKTAVLGHSMGGMLATRFTLMYPDFTDKLILENPIGLEDWKLKVPYKDINWWYQKELEKDYESIKKYQKESYYDGDWKPAYNK